MTFLPLLALLTASVHADPPADQAQAGEPSPHVDKAFLLVAASKSWDEARSTASQAAQALGLELKVKVQPHDTQGLTFSEADCTEGGMDHPCYVPRGRWDDGEYVSVEWSSGFEGFTPGLYVVMAWSGPESEAVSHLEAARAVYSDAYVKKASVYMGCMH